MFYVLQPACDNQNLTLWNVTSWTNSVICDITNTCMHTWFRCANRAQPWLYKMRRHSLTKAQSRSNSSWKMVLPTIELFVAVFSHLLFAAAIAENPANATQVTLILLVIAFIKLLSSCRDLVTNHHWYHSDQGHLDNQGSASMLSFNVSCDRLKYMHHAIIHARLGHHCPDTDSPAIGKSPY